MEETSVFLLVLRPEILIAVASGLLFSLFILLSRRRRHCADLLVDWPVFGMFPELLANLHRIHDLTADVMRRSGGTFVITGPRYLFEANLFTADPANVNHVFNTAFTNYPKGDEHADNFDVLGAGIFTTDDDSWAMQRKKAHKLVGFQSFRAFVLRRINRKIDADLMPLLPGFQESGEPVDLQDLMLRLTFDTTCELVFGEDTGCLSPGLPEVPFANAMDNAMGVILLRHTLPPLLWHLLRRLRLGPERTIIEARIAMDDFIFKSIDKKKKKITTSTKSSSEDEDHDLLSSYLEDDDFRSNRNLLRDVTLSLLLAGRDTTGGTLAWFFWLVATHPAVEAKILDELAAVAAAGAAPMLMESHEELGRLVYLHAALCEALRLYPPVPFNAKAPRERDVLPSGHTVTPNMRVVVLSYAMGRMESVWGEDCLQFRPERWIVTATTAKPAAVRHEPSYKFIAFHSGPRTCLGKDVAFTQMKAVAAAVLRRFVVEVVPGHIVKPKSSIILHMKRGLLVKLRSRRTQ